MTYGQPKCNGCKFFVSPPKGIGGRAECTAYKNGCPDRVYFEGGSCSKYTSGKKPTVKKSSRRK